MNWVIIGLGNGLLPIPHQAIIQINTDLLSIEPSERDLNEILVKMWKK